MYTFQEIAEKLLNSDNPSIRWKIRVNVFSEDVNSEPIKQLSEEIKNSDIVKQLLQNQTPEGRLLSKRDVYDKWQGAHWVMGHLADIGYPKGDELLKGAVDDLLKTWLAPDYYKEFNTKNKMDVYRKKGVPVMNGRHRRCAAQQGYTLYNLVKLGFEDKRIHDLVERLLYWQWGDGGWNCDKNPDASKSSFFETLLPMKGLYLYSQVYGEKRAEDAAMRASEVFLKRNLYKSLTDGEIINSDFIELHYPLYWRYDILGILKAFADMDIINDKRCQNAIDLLIGKFIPNKGFPAEKKFYKFSKELANGNDYVDWGGAGKKKMNEWVTADALYVLKKAGVF